MKHIHQHTHFLSNSYVGGNNQSSKKKQSIKKRSTKKQWWTNTSNYSDWWIQLWK